VKLKVFNGAAVVGVEFVKELVSLGARDVHAQCRDALEKLVAADESVAVLIPITE
jgi:hypothetical protein